MPRNFTAFVARTPEPDELADDVAACLGDEYSYEVAEPRRDEPDRVRIEGTGWFDAELEAAIEDHEVWPVDWAVVMRAMDEAVGVRAEVFDGDERVDSFLGRRLLQGQDTEAYLERFHGVLVASAGPYLPVGPFDPALELAAEQPDAVLADEPPEAPFEVTGTDYWVLAVAQTPDAAAFRDWLERSLREEDLLLDDDAEFVDRPWVTDGPTTVRLEESTVDDPDRARVRVPLVRGGLTEHGLRLPFDASGFDGSLDWVTFVYGDADEERADAWLFLEEDRRFTFEDGIDRVEGAPGAWGADVAAYLEEYYGIRIDPTPTGRAVPDDASTDFGDASPPSGYREALEEHGIDPPE